MSQPKLVDSLKQLGFPDSSCDLLCQFYRAKRVPINQVLLAAAIQLPTFKDLDWRVEAQVGSRAVPHQITPSVLMKLSLDGDGGCGGSNGTLMQVDASTLVQITRRLEEALSLATAPHTTRVQRRFRQM
ncbi:hypothetical protein AAG570_010767 [Ranatra chinensis]|uniref:COMM domain-containing protein n=1 Tax=Ranatra chinensis TaxID=642074 RepID=A0ABD0YNF9_9HEMI